MISNNATSPNSFLKVYKTVTIPVDSTGATGIPFFNSEADAVANNANPNHGALVVVRNNTKKAIFKFTKSPLEAPQDYIASYSLGRDKLIDTKLPGHPATQFAHAKDGDEFEIYGIEEIRKFEFTPLRNVGSPVAFFITIILFI